MSLEVLLAVSSDRTMATCKCLLMEGACPSTGSPLSGGLTKHGLQYIEIILILQFICD